MLSESNGRRVQYSRLNQEMMYGYAT
jgi:hypothetical protein